MLTPKQVFNIYFTLKNPPKLIEWVRFCNKFYIGENGCWNWTSSRNRLKYGYFGIKGKKQFAHRVSYFWAKEPIQKNLVIDHLCKNPSCVNPKHLEAVTSLVNCLRGNSPAAVNAKKTQCPQGHAYNNENTIPYGRKRHRYCRTCINERQNRKRYLIRTGGQ